MDPGARVRGTTTLSDTVPDTGRAGSDRAARARGAPAAQALIKGTAVQDSLEGMRARVGDEKLASVLAELEPGHRAALQEPILAMQWYSLDAFCALLDAWTRVELGGDPRSLAERAEQLVGAQLRGIYRLFVRLGSPEWLVKKIAVAHQTYFRGTDVEVVVAKPGQAVLRYVGFASRHRIVENVIVGFYRKALDISGAKEIQVRVTAPIADGRVAEVTMRWS